MNENLKTGERIRQVREGLSLTQKQFAEKLGFTSATISAYENNKKTPTFEFLIALAKNYNVSIDWACGLTENKNGILDIITYSDIIECLYKLSCAIELKLGRERVSFDGSLDYCDLSSITAQNEIFQIFLDEWDEMLTLKNKGTISDKLYRLWFEDKKQEYEIHINSIDNIEEKKFLEKKGYSAGYINCGNYEFTDDIHF